MIKVHPEQLAVYIRQSFFSTDKLKLIKFIMALTGWKHVDAESFITKNCHM
jgi:hypothetical protein